MKRSLLVLGGMTVALSGCAPNTTLGHDEMPVAVVPPVEFQVQAVSDYPNLYPDMKATWPGNLWVERSGTGRKLHFSNTIANLGPGHLQVRGRVVNGQTQAIQEIIDDYGRIKATKSIGYFVYHPTHEHFHIDQVARYRLTRYSPTGTVVREASKVTFCLMDSYVERYPAPTSRYRYCDEVLQGITRNWKDVYTANLPGQSLDVSGLSAGEYYLTTTTDPTYKFVDANRGNNLAWIKIYLDANNASYRVISRSP